MSFVMTYLWLICRETDEEKAKKQAAEVRRLKSQLKELQKQIVMKNQGTNNDDSEDGEGMQSDLDRLPPESEEENEVELNLSASVSKPIHAPSILMPTLSVEIRRISTVTQKPVNPVDKPRIRRREGSQPPERQSRQTTGSGSGPDSRNAGSDTHRNSEGLLGEPANNSDSATVSNGPHGGSPANISRTPVSEAVIPYPTMCADSFARLLSY